MQHLEVSGAVRHIYIYIYVIRLLKVNTCTVSAKKTARKDKTITIIRGGIFLEKLRVAEPIKCFACYGDTLYITPCPEPDESILPILYLEGLFQYKIAAQ